MAWTPDYLFLSASAADLWADRNVHLGLRLSLPVLLPRSPDCCSKTVELP